MSETTPMEFYDEGTKETVKHDVPNGRVDRYKGRGWKVAGESTSSASEDAAPYKGLKKADLQQLVDDRNADRDEDDQIVVGGNGTVKDLTAALEADDAASDAGGDEPTGD